MPLKQIDISFLEKPDHIRKAEVNEFLHKSMLQLQDARIWWVKRMAETNAGVLREKMTLFWHGHFATQTAFAHAAIAQNNTIRKHALGKFGDLVKAISRDPAMIYFLNTNRNRKGNINENFARELMELFTIGIGGYTETDIKEAARAFTGYDQVYHGEFIFRDHYHDKKKKSFMGRKGNFNGDEIIDIILEKKATARFIAAKVYRFFVNDRENDARINQLAKAFFDSDYDISVMMRELFNSEWFYAEENVGVRIKSPTELLVGMIQQLGMEFGSKPSLLFFQRTLGQMLFFPPGVDGWKEGKLWINSTTLLFRLTFAGLIAQVIDVSDELKEELSDLSAIHKTGNKKISANLIPLMQAFASGPDQALYNELADYMIQAPRSQSKMPFEMPEDRRKLLEKSVFHLMGLPEYQVC